MTSPLRTVVVGFGRVAAGYSEDPVMRKKFRYATHAQVLRDHPGFDWKAVVDISDDALRLARDQWHIPYTAHSLEDLPSAFRPDVAVIATPPGSRTEVIRRLTGLRAVLVEKPLGSTPTEVQEFLCECDQRRILVQVNLWRRGDQAFQELAGGKLDEIIGKPQAAFGIYGNGLLNNGTHLIDFVSMMLGEVVSVQTTGNAESCPGSSVGGDIDIPFVLGTRNGLTVAVQPVRFRHYREISLDIWGRHGRLAIMNEGLNIQVYRRGENRAVQGEFEIVNDDPGELSPTVGDALYRMYDNLSDAVNGGAPLWSSGRSSLAASNVIDGIRSSAADRGALVSLT